MSRKEMNARKRYLGHRSPLERLEDRHLLTSIVISEFVASNNNSLDDRDGNSSDWLELLNVSDETVDLAGWYLTDDLDELNKWRLPPKSMEPGEYLIVFASDKDRSNADGELHTNFKLSSGGESLAIVMPDGRTISHSYDLFPSQFSDVSYGVATSTVTSTVVDASTTGRVLVPDLDSDLAAEAWTEIGFDDGDWTEQAGAIGFSNGTFDSLIADDGDISHLVGDSSSSVYYRQPFQLEEAAGRYDDLQLEIQYDDGFAAYLNGSLVASRNAPDELAAISRATTKRGGTILSLEYPVFLNVVGVNTVGDALVNDGRIRLTGAEPSQTGAAWSRSPLRFDSRYSFSAFMELDVTQPGGTADGDGAGGHGMTFVLQSGGAFRLGSSGGGLGLDNTGMAFVAVELDSQETGSFDPDSTLPSHIGVTSSVDGNVARTAVPRFNGSSVADPRYLWVDYVGNDQLMKVYLSDVNEKPSEPTLSAPVNLADIFQGVPTLWAGWTAANGADTWNAHEVLDFEIDIFSEPAFDAQTIDLSEFAYLLQPGQNVFALHGLNSSPSDDDFLIKTKLTAINSNFVDLQEPGYLSEPTPGASNADISAPPSGAVQFNVEGKTFTEPFDLTIEAESRSAQIRYTVDGSIPDEESTLYQQPIRVDSSTRIRARAFEQGKEPGPVTSHGYIELAADLQDFEGGVFESNLPLMVFHSFGGRVHENATNLVPVSSVFINNDGGHANLLDEPEFAGRAGLRIRGQSSQGWPKKQYALEIWDEGNSDERPINASRADDRAISMFGLPKESDWVLNGPYSDKTQLNNFLTFNWSRSMGIYAPRTRLVEVFVKTNTGALNYRTDYRGTYVLLEKIKIDKNRVDIDEVPTDATEEPDITGGYIWKFDKDGVGDVNFSSSFQSRFGGRPWKFVEPERPPTVQRTWLSRHLREFETALYGRDFADPEVGYAKYIDVDSWVNTWLLVEFTKNIDGFRLSTYYHKDRGGKIKQGPAWDFNLSLANANYLRGAYATGWYHDTISSSQYPYWDRLFQDPNFEIRVRDRWFELRKTVFSTEQLLQDVDNAVSDLTDGNTTLGEVAPGQPSNPISRNFRRWGTLNSYLWPNCFFGTGTCPASPLPGRARPSSYEDYIFIMKDFIQDRTAWIDRQFRAPPVVSPNDTSLGQPVEVTLAAGSSGTLYYTVDGSDPRDSSNGGISETAIRYTEPFMIDENTQVKARTRSGTRWSALGSTTYIVETPSLAISEVNYHPAEPSNSEIAAGFADSEAFEFFEVTNFGAVPVELGGMQVREGVEVDLDSFVVQPDQQVVVVRNEEAFRIRYGNDPIVVGRYGDSIDESLDFKLNNSGERLVLIGSFGETIVDLTYRDDWYDLTDGEGYTLVLRDPNEGSDPNDKDAWRTSEFANGSPGQSPTGVVPPPDAVLINEVISQASGVEGDRLELFNPTQNPIDIGNYLLTLEALISRQMRLPQDTIVPARGYLELDRNLLGADFRLSSLGGAVTLRGALADGTPTGFNQHIEYGTTLFGQSWGNVQTLEGTDFARLSPATPLEANGSPIIGPLIISELQYHPNDDDPEFIEIQNVSDLPVQLSGWEFDSGIRFRLPDAVVPAGGFAVLVQIEDGVTADVAIRDFRANYGVPANVGVYAYSDEQHGSLANGGERIVLRQPIPGTNRTVEADWIVYSDMSPWPERADGLGPSLSKQTAMAYGNDPANWTTSTRNGTPGRDNLFEDPTPPSRPEQLAAAILDNGDVALGWHPSIDADGHVQEYVIYNNGREIATTQLTFFTTNVGWRENQTFSYQVAARNLDGFESELSNSAEVQVAATHFQQGISRYAGAADSRLRESAPDENYGDSTRLTLDGNIEGGAGSASFPLFRWDDISIPDDTRLVAAAITFNVANPGDLFLVQPIRRPWEESQVTWNQAANGQPWQVPGARGDTDIGDSVASFLTVARGSATVQLDGAGSDLVRGWVENPETNYGVIFADAGGSTDSAIVDSAQSSTAANRPRLSLFHTSLPIAKQGDFNFDGEINALDIDLIHRAIGLGVQQSMFDLSENGTVDQLDVDRLLELMGRRRGDVNLDGLIDFTDFLILSDSFGQEERTWESGDFDGDGAVSFADFLYLSEAFGNE